MATVLTVLGAPLVWWLGRRDAREATPAPPKPGAVSTGPPTGLVSLPVAPPIPCTTVPLSPPTDWEGGPQDESDAAWALRLAQRDCEHDRWIEAVALDRPWVRRWCEDCSKDLGEWVGDQQVTPIR